MPRAVDAGDALTSSEVCHIKAASQALLSVPVKASLTAVFDAIRPCIPLAAGLFVVIRPDAPASMVTQVSSLPMDVFESWLGTPRDQLARTLAPVLVSDAGQLWRDSQTVTGSFREELEVLRKLDASNLGEGGGYKLLERINPLYGREHLLLVLIMERHVAFPERAQAMLSALHGHISAATFRIGLPILESEPVLAQISAERSTGYICLSRRGAVLEANRRAYELASRFRQAAGVEDGRGVLTKFASRARESAAPGRSWHLEVDDPRALLDVSVHLLSKETHAIPEDIVLLLMSEIVLQSANTHDLLRRAGLTARETQLALLLAGTAASHKELALDVGCSVQTVGKHIQNIYRKLSVRSRPELTVLMTQSSR